MIGGLMLWFKVCSLIKVYWVLWVLVACFMWSYRMFFRCLDCENGAVLCQAAVSHRAP